ncbi:MAG: GMC family oxidoreductase [Flavobacterium sp.]|nr:GMC family oxidoreductase [Pedobacter sp.]
MRSYQNNEIVDVIVIGTGAGGAPLLARFAKAGLKAVALEAGKHWDPKADFATDEKEQNKLFWNFERLSAGKDPIPFGKNNSGIGVGGSTLHYTAYTPRPHPEDFHLYSDFGVGEDWPITYFDLEPYFDELEQFLGISGPSPYPWGPPRKTSYPLPPLALNGPAQLMQRGCKKIGINTSPAANAALSAAYYQEHVGWRQACTNRGFCQAGCSTGAKASVDVTFIPLAVHYGAEIRPECFAINFERNGTGSITAVVYKKNGKEERQLCHNVFLCAGTVETPRLLLLNNTANSSGQVGKNFMAHVGLQVWGEFEEEVRPNKGIPGGLISEDMRRPKDADFASGYLIQSIGVMPVTYAAQLARSGGIWGEALRTKMQAFNQVGGINMHGECLPDVNNYLELSDELDETGLPKPRIYFTAGENQKRMSIHGEAVMRRIWTEAGAKNILSHHRNAHTIGTCRMGNSGDKAVVNAAGRSFEVPNLYICDNSVFPSTLAVNPALTIMALSLRTADLFLSQKN